MSTEARGNPSLLRRSDTLLVIVDMQEPFLRNILGRDRLVRNVSILLESARILRVPTITTVQNRERMGGFIPELASILPEGNPYFDKMCFSCTGSRPVLEEIEGHRRQQVLLCGVETHICINQTAHDLLALGFQVHIPADAVSSRGSTDAEVALRRMERAGAVVTTTEAAVYELLGKAGTPEFKSVLQLVR